MFFLVCGSKVPRFQGSKVPRFQGSFFFENHSGYDDTSGGKRCRCNPGS